MVKNYLKICLVIVLLSTTIMVCNAFTEPEPECLGPSLIHAWVSWTPECYCEGSGQYVQAQNCRTDPNCNYGCTVITCAY